ncbi:uncharacterized protein LOC129592042 [Paramacrobiotus metropolitanus]|uniref:uncharacterized protein LOC129592042 n=1 Tax=Paramacrobiotus metropolitanus TaxID=2943436 RepID=UPI00244587CC|nr:uncharacterized protein LOC129592042 [Paramacrobiotus metropolitanus]XP_055343959.1 uncharacterized protein LOC129592042 [Paramacrobiotus metropolitanus]
MSEKSVETLKTPAKVVPPAGSFELRSVAWSLLVCGGLTTVLTIATIYFLPYWTFAMLHVYNCLVPLLLLVVGIKIKAVARRLAAGTWNPAEEPDYVSYMVKRMVCPLGIILVGFSDFFGTPSSPTGLFNQVIAMVQTKNWGHLSPTDWQVETLGILYMGINTSHSVAGLTLAFGAIVGTTVWISRAYDAAASGQVKDDKPDQKDLVKAVDGTSCMVENEMEREEENEHDKMLESAA